MGLIVSLIKNEYATNKQWGNGEYVDLNILDQHIQHYKNSLKHSSAFVSSSKTFDKCSQTKERQCVLFVHGSLRCAFLSYWQ